MNKINLFIIFLAIVMFFLSMVSLLQNSKIEKLNIELDKVIQENIVEKKVKI